MAKTEQTSPRRTSEMIHSTRLLRICCCVVWVSHSCVSSLRGILTYSVSGTPGAHQEPTRSFEMLRPETLAIRQQVTRTLLRRSWPLTSSSSSSSSSSAFQPLSAAVTRRGGEQLHFQLKLVEFALKTAFNSWALRGSDCGQA